MAAEYTPNDTILKAMIDYLQGWLEDNPGLRMSISDSIKYNIAYVEVVWFKEIDNDVQKAIKSTLPDDYTVGFKTCFKVLQSAFDNNIFN